MDCRKNIYSLSDTELANFLTAVNAIKADGRYDEFIMRHHMAMDELTLFPGEVGTTRNAAHRGPSFLPWHRYFIREFEQTLQTVIPSVTLPYWDWATDAALPDPTTAPIWNDDPMAGRVYIGGDGDPVTSGPFAGWTALIEAGGGGFVARPGGLIRELGSASSLPSQTQVDGLSGITTYDSTPWSESQTTTPSLRNRLEGWLREPGESGSQLHNRVHVWVGGDMSPGTSPNDPVFFLHHCNVDRLWAQWQAANPGVPYVPNGGGPPQHNLTDVMTHLTTPGPTPAFSLDYRHNIGYMYDTDAPLVELVNAGVAFTNVPEGETTYRAAVFRVYACANVTLEITSPIPAPFGATSLGAVFVVPPAHGPYVEGRVWFAYTAGAAGVAVPPAVVQVHCAETGETFDLTLTASSVARETCAVVLALDQSGSMDAPAGTTGATRIEVLREAAARFVELVQTNNGVGLVRFDHDAYPGVGVTQIVDEASRTTVRDAVLAHATNPSGMTSVGDGVALARTTIAPVAGYINKAIVVLTDGIENSPESLESVMMSSVDERTFAIGLGTAAQVDTGKLSMLANNTAGYLLLTDNLTPDTDDYFRLTKYFHQILAGVTNTSIVTDPSGTLAPGATLRIPFVLNEADIEGTAILLYDVPAVGFAVETPGGDLIEPSTAASFGAAYTVGTNMSFYRFPLPLPTPSGSAHAGTWYAVLRVDEGGLKQGLAGRGDNPRADSRRGAAGALPAFDAARARAHGVRYSLSVHAYSNLRLNVRLTQDSFEPGATLTLRAVLTEYGLTWKRHAHLRAELRRPDNTTALIPLKEVEPSVYEASTRAAMPGVYHFRALADGNTLKGLAFTREQLLTGGVSQGGDHPFPVPAEPSPCAARLCKWLWPLVWVWTVLLVLILILLVLIARG